MSTFALRMLLAAFAAVSCIQLLRGKNPAMALLLSAAALLSLAGILLPQIQDIWQELHMILEHTGLEKQLFMPVVKVLAITQISRLSAELCRDAGERAIAVSLELGSAVASLFCILPLMKEALTLIGAFGT